MGGSAASALHASQGYSHLGLGLGLVVKGCGHATYNKIKRFTLETSSSGDEANISIRYYTTCATT